MSGLELLSRIKVIIPEEKGFVVDAHTYFNEIKIGAARPPFRQVAVRFAGRCSEQKLRKRIPQKSVTLLQDWAFFCSYKERVGAAIDIKDGRNQERGQDPYQSIHCLGRPKLVSHIGRY